MFAMTAPRPLPVTSRMNAGGYEVWVRHYVEMYELDPEYAFTADEYRGARDLSGWGRSTWGNVTPDGSLSVEPEAWRTRHYRRAVMRGAGVYRLGLWAFLAARRVAHFPRPEPGAFVEPHRVKLKAWDRVSPRDLGGDWGACAALNPCLTVPYVDVGRVARNGSLSWAGQRQRGVYYRRAVMRGAGVYLAGLWAHLAARRAPDAQAGAALGVPVNGAALLDAFTPWGQAPPLPLPPAAVSFTGAHARHAQRWIGREVSFAGVPELKENPLFRELAHDALRSAYKAIWGDRNPFALWRDPRSRPQYTGTPESLARCLSAAREELAQLAAERGAGPVAYARAERLLRRALRRMVPRRARAPQAARLPRPLYSRAIPPAAPLAPPALA